MVFKQNVQTVWYFSGVFLNSPTHSSVFIQRAVAHDSTHATDVSVRTPDRRRAVLAQVDVRDAAEAAGPRSGSAGGAARGRPGGCGGAAGSGVRAARCSGVGLRWLGAGVSGGLVGGDPARCFSCLWPNCVDGGSIGRQSIGCRRIWLCRRNCVDGGSTGSRAHPHRLRCHRRPDR